MKLDVTKILTKFDGDNITIHNMDVELCPQCAKKLTEAKQPLTLRLVCTKALTSITQKTQQLSGQKKFERGELARKIHNENEPNLTVDDIILIREVVGEVEGPLVVLQVFELLKELEE